MNRDNKIVITVQGGDEKKSIASPKTVVEVKGKSIDRKEVDLVFVIDTTGSMSNKIDGLLHTCAKFIDEFSQLNLDYRVAIIAFGDLTVPGDKIEVIDFMTKVETIKKSLKEIPRYGGGGNEGESSLEAIAKATSLGFRAQTVKVIILITDEPALQHELNADIVIRELTRKEFLTFVISPPLNYFKEMADKNGGKWYQVSDSTDFTDLLEMFKQVAMKVSQVVSNVYKLGHGSVASYLRLNPPDKQ